MGAADVLEFLKSLLGDDGTTHDGGITVEAAGIEDGELLVDLNGAYFAIRVDEM